MKVKYGCPSHPNPEPKTLFQLQCDAVFDYWYIEKKESRDIAAEHVKSFGKNTPGGRKLYLLNYSIRVEQ